MLYNELKQLNEKVKKHVEMLNLQSDYKTFTFKESAKDLLNNKLISKSDFKALDLE